MVTTISVDEEVKKLLENLKGNKDWSTFLRELAEEYATLKREKVRKELGELFEAEFEDVKVRRWAREY
ncbi:antitoxin VapB family protein [Archaeoglobus sp.]|uniref:antitoxin VapB family protein n=1 Tax=Archaeoglobus sp. TaxID=1872626 RepID=UPI0024AA1B42|nr:antitoxin VapB family protein [Archaeoglobus sp.]MDI3498164.1 hypothetical protein [Archaeoglobus sp.]